MSDECSVTVVRAWSQANQLSNLLIRMINDSQDDTSDRHFTSIDDAVEQLRLWLTVFEQSIDPSVRPSSTRRRDDADETLG